MRYITVFLKSGPPNKVLAILKAPQNYVSSEFQFGLLAALERLHGKLELLLSSLVTSAEPSTLELRGLRLIGLKRYRANYRV